MDVHRWLSLRYRNIRQGRLRQQWLLRRFVGGRLTTSFHDCGSCWTCGVGAVSPPSSCQRQLGQLPCVVGNGSAGRYVVGSSDPRSRGQQIVAGPSSEDRRQRARVVASSVKLKLKFCRIV